MTELDLQARAQAEAPDLRAAREVTCVSVTCATSCSGSWWGPSSTRRAREMLAEIEPFKSTFFVAPWSGSGSCSLVASARRRLLRLVASLLPLPLPLGAGAGAALEHPHVRAPIDVPSARVARSVRATASPSLSVATAPSIRASASPAWSARPTTATARCVRRCRHRAAHPPSATRPSRRRAGEAETTPREGRKILMPRQRSL